MHIPSSPSREIILKQHISMTTSLILPVLTILPPTPASCTDPSRLPAAPTALVLLPEEVLHHPLPSDNEQLPRLVRLRLLPHAAGTSGREKNTLREGREVDCSGRGSSTHDDLRIPSEHAENGEGRRMSTKMTS
ncbi:hypothetical protein BD309DRAFT_610221 [Dichomitus squalens]|nr:hypothetical protein BD309DRAFT_610221 [Dichomitus squalens]